MDITDTNLFKYLPSVEIVSATQTQDWDRKITLKLTFADSQLLTPMDSSFTQSIFWPVSYKDSFIQIFSYDITDPHQDFIGKKASVLVYLEDSIPKIIAFGKEHEKPIMNRANLDYDSFEAINFQSYMLYKVPPNPNALSRPKNKV